MQKFTNNASTTLASSITISGTSVTVATGKGALFATIASPDYQLATITDGTNVEIVKITARTSDTLTVTRGYDGTTARAWSSGVTIEARLDASTLYRFPQLDFSASIGPYANATGVTLQAGRDAATKCATGDYSVAIGYSSTASAGEAIAIGLNAQSTLSGGICIGGSASCTNGYATVVGRGAGSSGWASVALGAGATANGAYAAALGDNSVANYQESVSVGNAATASESGSVALGSTANAGWHAVAIGYGASGTHAGNVAIGNGANCTGDWMTAVGQGAYCSGGNGTSFGVGASCNGANSMALGNNAVTRIANSVVLSGAIITRKDDGINAADASLYLTGAEVVYTSKEVDLKIAQTITIDIPTGAKFYPDEVGVIVTTVSSPTAQPTVSFGITGSNASLLAATAITKSTQFGRNRYTTLLSSDGIQSLTATITVAATGTTFMGRFYFKGLLIEAQ